MKDYEPKSFKEGLCLWLFTCLLFGSLWLGFTWGGWFWALAFAGIIASFYGFKKTSEL
jgi:uncharacterized membrane protein YccC